MGKRRPLNRKERKEARTIKRAERRALKLIAKQERRQSNSRNLELGLAFWNLEYNRCLAENRRRRTARLEDVKGQVVVTQDETVEIEWTDLDLRSNESISAQDKSTNSVLNNFLDKVGI